MFWALPGKLIEEGRYNDAVGLEHTSNKAIKTFEILLQFSVCTIRFQLPRRSSFRIS